MPKTAINEFGNPILNEKKCLVLWVFRSLKAAKSCYLTLCVGLFLRKTPIIPLLFDDVGNLDRCIIYILINSTFKWAFFHLYLALGKT